jgi:hypothetical protein
MNGATSLHKIVNGIKVTCSPDIHGLTSAPTRSHPLEPPGSVPQRTVMTEIGFLSYVGASKQGCVSGAMVVGTPHPPDIRNANGSDTKTTLSLYGYKYHQDCSNFFTTSTSLDLLSNSQWRLKLMTLFRSWTSWS